MASPIVTPDDVLEILMNDGTIDTLRFKIINQLKANEELKKYTITMAEQSKVLNTPGAEKQSKRELFNALRSELESPVLEKASKAVWELILDSNGLGKEIDATVEEVFCRLSGSNSSLFAQPNDSCFQTLVENKSGNLVADGQQNQNGEEKMGKEDTIRKDSPSTSSKMCFATKGTVSNKNSEFYSRKRLHSNVDTQRKGDVTSAKEKSGKVANVNEVADSSSKKRPYTEMYMQGLRDGSYSSSDPSAGAEEFMKSFPLSVCTLIIQVQSGIKCTKNYAGHCSCSKLHLVLRTWFICSVAG